MQLRKNQFYSTDNGGYIIPRSVFASLSDKGEPIAIVELLTFSKTTWKKEHKVVSKKELKELMHIKERNLEII